MALTKPRVTQLAVFCAVIGMFATPGMVPWHVLIGGTVGIWLRRRRVRDQLPSSNRRSTR